MAVPDWETLQRELPALEPMSAPAASVEHEPVYDRWRAERRAIFHAFRIGEPIDLGDREEVRRAIDRFTEAIGYSRLGREIEEPRALAALDALVRFDQAYDGRVVRSR